MSGDNRIEVVRPFGHGHARLVALLAAALLAGVAYVGVSGRWQDATPPASPSAPAAGVPSVTPIPATPSGPQLELGALPAYRIHQAGDYGVVISYGSNGGIASAPAALAELEPGQLWARYDVAMPDEPTPATVQLVQFGAGNPQDDQVIGSWVINVSWDLPRRLLDVTTPPAIDAVHLPRLVRAGYRLQAALVAVDGPISLSVTVTAGRVDVLHPREVYVVQTVASGAGLRAELYPVDIEHLQATEIWPAEFPRQVQFILALTKSADAQLVDPEVIGSWSARVRPAARVPPNGVSVLDAKVNRQDGISILAAVGYHITVTEMVNLDGIHLTFDVDPNSPA